MNHGHVGAEVEGGAIFGELVVGSVATAQESGSGVAEVAHDEVGSEQFLQARGVAGGGGVGEAVAEGDGVADAGNARLALGGSE